MAKQNSPNTKRKADIDFEKELWGVVNELPSRRGVVMANGSKTSGSAGEKNVREYMLYHLVDYIVQMPDKLLLNSGIPVCLFILSKNRDGCDGEHCECQQELLFIDARKFGQMAIRRLRVFYNDIVKIADTYHHWGNFGKMFFYGQGIAA